MFRAVDIMCEAISEMDINAISENRHAAYNSGWGELKFTAGDISELKSRRRIENQEEYIYCRKMMEGEDTADHQARANQQLYKGFRDLGIRCPSVCRDACSNQIWYESPQTTRCLIYLFCKKISNCGDYIRIFCFFWNGTQVFATVITLM